MNSFRFTSGMIQYNVVCVWIVIVCVVALLSYWSLTPKIVEGHGGGGGGGGFGRGYNTGGGGGSRGYNTGGGGYNLLAYNRPRMMVDYDGYYYQDDPYYYNPIYVTPYAYPRPYYATPVTIVPNIPYYY